MMRASPLRLPEVDIGKSRQVREYRAIIAMLQRRRKAAGMTQWDLARALGTDQSQISKLERNERRVDIVDYLRMPRDRPRSGKALRSAISGKSTK